MLIMYIENVSATLTRHNFNFIIFYRVFQLNVLNALLKTVGCINTPKLLHLATVVSENKRRACESLGRHTSRKLRLHETLSSNKREVYFEAANRDSYAEAGTAKRRSREKFASSCRLPTNRVRWNSRSSRRNTKNCASKKNCINNALRRDFIWIVNANSRTVIFHMRISFFHFNAIEKSTKVIFVCLFFFFSYF